MPSLVSQAFLAEFYDPQYQMLSVGPQTLL